MDGTNLQESGQIRVQVTASISITAPIARRLVNVELMKKVGQMIMTGEPEIYIDGKNIYWKVPLLVVPPDDDDNTYLLGKYALVDAIAGRYTMDKQFIEELRAEARPILERLYPETKAWVQKIKELRKKCS